jgi:FkbM family methyltransferase
MRKLPAFLANKGFSRIPYLTKIIDHFYKKSEIDTIYGHHMFLDKQDSMNLSRWGFYERQESERIRETIHEGQIVLDIGANIGYFTLLLAATVGPTGRVIAFEPDPTNYDLLVRNIIGNDYDQIVAAENLALSNYSGTTNFFRSSISSGMHTCSPAMQNHFPTYENPEVITVPCMTLDDYFPLAEHITFIKLDVEGFELQVLEGAKDFLELNPDLEMLIEYSTNPEQYLAYLEPLFTVEKLNDKNLWCSPK